MLNQTFPLLDTNVSCKSASGALAGVAEIKVDVDARVQAVVNYGFNFGGSLFPVRLSSVSAPI